MKNKYLKNKHWRNKLQHTGSHYNTLQHTNNTLQHTNKRITVCSPTKWPCTIHCNTQTQYTATHKQAYHCIYIIMETKYQRYADWRKILQHTATHCNILQHTATHKQAYHCIDNENKILEICRLKEIIATHCSTLQLTATHWNTQASELHWIDNEHKIFEISTSEKILQHTTTHYHILQYTTTHKKAHSTESTMNTTPWKYPHRRKILQHTATHYHILLYTAA